MATTRIIPMHRKPSKSISSCLHDRIDYAENPEKTDDGELIKSYMCDPMTADAEFALSKREYLQITGRRQERDVIAYQIRQSFKPGEITPEEANAIGYEFAKRFTKENHAFIVCTHIDKAHIHNHIIWNSTSIDCTHKFRNFWGSTRAVRKLSDLICIEHGLSIIENPKPHGKSYNSRFDDCKKKSIRDYLRQDIDEALSEKPKTFEDFFMLLSEKGYTVKKGKNISVSHARQKRYIRLSSLGSGYSEAEIRGAIFGNRKQKTCKKNIAAPIKPTLLSEIQSKLHSGKGAGYDRWASVFKAKQMAKTILYLQENGISSLDEISQKSVALKSRYAELSQGIKQREKRLAEIAVLRTQIINYSKTRAVYADYRKSGYSKKFLDEHESDIIIHKAAKKAFDDLGVTKLPTVKDLNAEYSKLLSEKKAIYAEYYSTQNEMRDILVHQANIEFILSEQAEKTTKHLSHEK